MIRSICYLLLQVFLLFLFLGGFGQASPHPKAETLSPELVRDYNPKTKTQYDLLLIFQKARIERRRNPDLSIFHYQEFYEKSVKAGEHYFAATALFEICRVYMDRDLYFPAMEFSLRAYQILTDNHLEDKANYFMIGIGNCYFQTGNYLIAEGYYRKAELLFVKGKDYYGMAVAENNIGLVKQKLNQKDSALWYFQKALSQRRKTKGLANIGHSYYYIGSAYLQLGKLEKARNYFEMAIPLLHASADDLFLKHDFISTMADVYFELGNLSESQSRHSEALKNYFKAIEICDTISEHIKMPEIYIAMGHTYAADHDFVRALVAYRNALHISDSAKLPALRKSCYENMIRVFVVTRQTDSVSAYFNKYRRVTDTIQAQMINSRFKEIHLALRIRETETEAKELKEINRLSVAFLVIIAILLLFIIIISVIYTRKQRKNVKIAKAEIKARKQAEGDLEKLNRELKEINESKDRFISILSHDLRSPFNALMGFADLLVEETADKNIPEIRHYSKMVQQISRGTFQLLENLLTWSRMQIGTIPFQPVNLQLYDEVSVVIDAMMVLASRKSIRIRNLVNADAIVLADNNMLQAIFRNLISNAVKFSKPEGVIEIRSELKEGLQVIRVSDKGIGISKEIREKLFREAEELVSTKGTDNEKGHGLGLLLCLYMVEKNGGTIWIESTSEKGSTFAFTLPASGD